MGDENGAHHIGTGEQTTSLLVFRAGSSQPKAVPLGLVTRLEELPPTRSSSPTAATWCSTASS
jgi:two-component system chemotaxis sensor kinase CheA